MEKIWSLKTSINRDILSDSHIDGLIKGVLIIINNKDARYRFSFDNNKWENGNSNNRSGVQRLIVELYDEEVARMFFDAVNGAQIGDISNMKWESPFQKRRIGNKMSDVFAQISSQTANASSVVASMAATDLVPLIEAGDANKESNISSKSEENDKISNERRINELKNRIIMLKKSMSNPSNNGSDTDNHSQSHAQKDNENAVTSLQTSNKNMHGESNKNEKDHIDRRKSRHRSRSRSRDRSRNRRRKEKRRHRSRNRHSHHRSRSRSRERDRKRTRSRERNKAKEDKKEQEHEEIKSESVQNEDLDEKVSIGSSEDEESRKRRKKEKKKHKKHNKSKKEKKDKKKKKKRSRSRSGR